MNVQELPAESGVASALIDGRLAYKMAHLRGGFPETMDENAIIAAERIFRKENPEACKLLKAGSTKQWGWYLYDSAQNLFADFVNDADKLSDIKANSSFLMGFNVGKSREASKSIEVTFQGQSEVITAKTLHRAKEIIEMLDERVRQLSPKPRVRVQAARVAA